MRERESESESENESSKATRLTCDFALFMCRSVSPFLAPPFDAAARALGGPSAAAAAAASGTGSAHTLKALADAACNDVRRVGECWLWFKRWWRWVSCGCA